MQIAYGVDLDGDGRVTRYTATTPPDDTDPDSTSIRPDGTAAVDDDEWVPNADGETALTPDQFQQDATAFTTTPHFAHGSQPPSTARGCTA